MARISTDNLAWKAVWLLTLALSSIATYEWNSLRAAQEKQATTIENHGERLVKIEASFATPEQVNSLKSTIADLKLELARLPAALPPAWFQQDVANFKAATAKQFTELDGKVTRVIDIVTDNSRKLDSHIAANAK